MPQSQEKSANPLTTTPRQGIVHLQTLLLIYFRNQGELQDQKPWHSRELNFQCFKTRFFKKSVT